MRSTAVVWALIDDGLVSEGAEHGGQRGDEERKLHFDLVIAV